MERLLLEAHTVQNLSLKGTSCGGAGDGSGAGAIATGAAGAGAALVRGGESTLPSRNGDVVGAGCIGGSTGIGVVGAGAGCGGVCAAG